MYMESFWKKHANDSDWDSRYIDIDRSTALADFTQTVVGSGTATYGSTGLVLVNSAGASDSIQYQYNLSTIQAKAPKTPTVLKPSIYPYEIEFIVSGIVASPVSVVGALGFYNQDSTILTGHSDSIGLQTMANVGSMGLDLYASNQNLLLNYPAGGPNPNAFGYLPVDGLAHELCFQAVPMAGNGQSGEFRVWLDGELVQIFGLADPTYWVGLTSALLAPAFAFGNSTAGLAAALRTVTIQKIGWAVRR